MLTKSSKTTTVTYDWSACLREDRFVVKNTGNFSSSNDLVDTAVADCIDKGVASLVYASVKKTSSVKEVSSEFSKELKKYSQKESAIELTRKRAVKKAIDILFDANIPVLIFKGTALAYSLYKSPAQRPRCDTDLFIRKKDQKRAKQVLLQAGYFEPVYCQGEYLFYQYMLYETDDFGVEHVLDIHWKISCREAFADIFSFEELAQKARRIPKLSANAKAVGNEHALLIACIHPVMHHRNACRLIWLYDIHLLLHSLNRQQTQSFIALIEEKRVETICLEQIKTCGEILNTRIPEAITDQLAKLSKCRPTGERTSRYLDKNRKMYSDILSDFLLLKGSRNRIRLLREIVLPSISYMRQKYHLPQNLVGNLLLMLSYIWRGLRGMLKLFRV